jgi:hypothetical protein
VELVSGSSRSSRGIPQAAFSVLLLVAPFAVAYPEAGGRPIDPWPIEGSYATYRLHAEEHVPFTRHTYWDGVLHVTYRAGEWVGACHGTETVVQREFTTGLVTTTTVPWAQVANFAPPQTDTQARPNDALEVAMIVVFRGCEIMQNPIVVCCAHPWETEMVDDEGHRLTVNAWIGREPPETNVYQNILTAWDREHGLLVHWQDISRRGNGFDGDLIETDADFATIG